ncbi:UDP-N-acetylmuramoyl-L-alanyl-D-glutamate--L-lysine ligase [Streptococcus sciuri]|uniref:UDP-N-acetylmuramoyl-L-alanyl-D-glutamate--L-lysine ligase n=1 Tax=Streptococcus sciuri TaxID=2973939 RepID=A0ABT2FA97_9STRE|nr:UDP-N-acetylmuramoyl-L-alanyl-D-glutamate--L-lysine ligase [Streptococcus sciuri]MCS4488757.1 UDP-N-acetylmuramoyl-L-alanyl-D-glutamate--L-lysine ligase [Streptococcus sciuri]
MITLADILDILKKDQNFREIITDGTYHYNWSKQKTFHKLSYDSRDVDSETLFFIKGAQFKPEFLEKAVADGLCYYISEKDYQMGIPAILVNDVRQAMSLIAKSFYDNPQEELTILAFTGTKGKTTAAYFAYHILSESHKPALISTMNTTIDGKTFFKSQLTTPESLDLFRLMAQARDHGRTHLVMEVSSQAYLMKRVYGLTFDVGIFLNISPDHIGPIEHPSFEDYFYHKRLLMDNSKSVVVNSDMNHFAIIAGQVATKVHDFFGSKSDNRITNSKAFSFSLTGKCAGDYSIQLIGHFNQENATAAALACYRLGVNLSDIQAGIARTSVPGRMEVLTQKNGAKVFIDYAHNGDSLEKLLSVVEPHQTGTITLIIGATGNKGESRRKDFGRVISQHHRIKVILTADDPNFENPEAICSEIASYINRPVQIIVDRELAIKTALTTTKTSDDAVIIAGKGADAFQLINGKRTVYKGDRTIASQYL